MRADRDDRLVVAALCEKGASTRTSFIFRGSKPEVRNIFEIPAYRNFGREKCLQLPCFFR